MIDPDEGAVTLDKAEASGLLGYPDIVGKDVLVAGREGLWRVVAVGPIGLLIESTSYETRLRPPKQPGRFRFDDDEPIVRECRPSNIRRALVPWVVSIDWTDDAPDSEWEVAPPD